MIARIGIAALLVIGIELVYRRRAPSLAAKVVARVESGSPLRLCLIASVSELVIAGGFQGLIVSRALWP